MAHAAVTYIHFWTNPYGYPTSPPQFLGSYTDPNWPSFGGCQAGGSVFPPPPFTDPISPVLASSASDWAGKVLSIPAWSGGQLIGTFDPDKKAMISVIDSGFQSVIAGTPSSGGSDPADVISYIAVGGPGASLVDVAVYSGGTDSNVKYQGWTGSGWSDRPSISVGGIYWYRGVIKPRATVFYAKTYRGGAGASPSFTLWAFQGNRP
jgi:hypothetical protein